MPKQSSTTPPAGDTPAPSTEPAAPLPDPAPFVGISLVHPDIGDIVLVRIDLATWRPLLVTAAGYTAIDAQVPETEFRLSGTIHCEPEDHTTLAFRGGADRYDDPARIYGRPDRLFPFGYGERLKEGHGMGNWRRKP